jgi:hypothetical protein
MQSRTNSSPETGKFTGNTSLDSEVARLFVSYCLGVMKVLHAWAAIEQGKTGNSLGISDPPAFPPNEVFEAPEFRTRLNGASIVFSIGLRDLENHDGVKYRI